MNTNQPALMTTAQVEDYAAWLKRLAGGRRGRLADHLRAAASALANPWSHQCQL